MTRGSTSGTTPAAIDAALQASEAARQAGDHAAGAAHAEAALAAARGDDTRRARALELLALHRMRLGDEAQAVRHGNEALRLYDAAGDLSGASRVHTTLTLAHHAVSLDDAALRHGIEALRTARAAGDTRAQCWALNRLGIVHRALGDFDRSIAFADQAVALARALGSDEELFAALNNRAITRAGEARRRRRAHDGDPAQALGDALDDAQQALALAEATGNRHRVALGQAVVAQALIALGRHQDGLAHAALALRLGREGGLRHVVLDTQVLVGEALEACGDLAGAIAAFECATGDADGDGGASGAAHLALYRLHKAGGRHERALAHHERFHALELRDREARADLQTRVLAIGLELERLQEQAERARRDAEIQRLRAEQLDHDAHHDALTGLLNRRFLDDRMPQLAARTAARGLPLSAAMIDIDRFKQVNDRFGHGVGDRVLQALARVVEAATRGSDIAARLGGEEFLVLFVDTPREGALEISERLRGLIEAQPWSGIDPALAVTASIGVATLRDGEDAAAWLARADAALYAAKAAGRNRVEAAD